MHHLQSFPRITWLGYVAALGAVGLVTGLIAVLVGRLPIANISMLYLIAVLATAVACGSGPAVLASVAAFVTFDWFFVDPQYTFAVANPSEWVSLLLFLLTAIVTGQLAARQRQRAREAREREREAVVLYDVVRLMSDPDLHRALQAVATRLAEELALAAVVIELAADGQQAAPIAVGEPWAIQLIRSRNVVESHVLSTGQLPSTTSRGVPGTWRRIVPPYARSLKLKSDQGRLHQVPVMELGQRQGSLLLVRHARAQEFSPGDDRLLSAVGAQLAGAVERARLRRDATEAEILRRTDDQKTALLNAVSHDLRTPLASIITAAGSLRQEDVCWTDEDRRGFARDIEQEALRLNRIVGNLLDLSRIEDGSLRPEKGWYDLGALVDDVLGRLRTMTAQHRLVVEVPEDLPPVPLDYVEIDQVLSNLVENATRYAPPGTEVRISARRVDREVHIVVEDQGPGIAPAALARVFRPFCHIDTAASRPHGIGLGLAIVKGLIEAHQGRIRVENRPGGGARFAFTLPLDGLDVEEAGAGRRDA